MSTIGEQAPRPLDFLRQQLLSFCLDRGLGAISPASRPNLPVRLGSEFSIADDIPNTFPYLMSAFDAYEVASPIESGVWPAVGEITWLWLSDTTLEDPRLDKVRAIFGCRPQLMFEKAAIVPQREINHRYPFAEGYDLQFAKETRRPIEGGAGTLVSFRLPKN